MYGNKETPEAFRPKRLRRGSVLLPGEVLVTNRFLRSAGVHKILIVANVITAGIKSSPLFTYTICAIAINMSTKGPFGDWTHRFLWVHPMTFYSQMDTINRLLATFYGSSIECLTCL